MIASLLNAIFTIPSLDAVVAAFPRLARHLREPRRKRQYQAISCLS